MPQEKLDAMKMKRSVQAEIHEEYGHLSILEMRKQFHKELMAADDPLSRWYQQEMSKRPATVAEDPAAFNTPTKES